MISTQQTRLDFTLTYLKLNSEICMIMELKREGEFSLRGFSPHQLTFLPSLNTVLVSDGKGAFRSLDIVTGKDQSLPGQLIMITRLDTICKFLILRGCPA